MPDVPAVADCQHMSYEDVSGASKFHVYNWCIRCGTEMATQYQEKEDDDKEAQ